MLDILLIATIAIIIGANDASNVFGSAVGSKMLKFKISIIFFIIFIILGAIINAGNPSQVYGNLVLDYPDLKNILNNNPSCNSNDHFSKTKNSKLNLSISYIFINCVFNCTKTKC